MKINFLLLTSFILLLTSCKEKEEDIAYPISQSYFNPKGAIDSISIKYHDSIVILRRNDDSFYKGVTYDKTKSRKLSIGNYIIKNPESDPSTIILNGWFRKFNTNGGILYDADIKFLGDSSYFNQLKVYDSNQQIIEGKSSYYTILLEKNHDIKNHIINGKITLHYQNELNQNDIETILILSDKINSDFSNIKQLTSLKNIYNTQKIDSKNWSFTYDSRKIKSKDLKGFISFRDIMRSPENADSSKIKFKIVDKIIFVDERNLF